MKTIDICLKANVEDATTELWIDGKFEASWGNRVLSLDLIRNNYVLMQIMNRIHDRAFSAGREDIKKTLKELLS